VEEVELSRGEEQVAYIIGSGERKRAIERKIPV
jgi:hypothetical protein